MSMERDETVKADFDKIVKRICFDKDTESVVLVSIFV